MSKGAARVASAVAVAFVASVVLAAADGRPPGDSAVARPAVAAAAESAPHARADDRGERPPPPGDVQIAPAPSRFDRPARRPGRLPAALRNLGGVRASGGVWAVVIGINDYPGTKSDLRSAVNDANDVDEALSRFGVPADHRLVLRDGDATGAAIVVAGDWLVAHASDEATAVFFYAGHARRQSSSRHAIVGSDGSPVTDGELRDRLAHLRAARTWIGIAACYGGGFDELVAPGRVLSAAAGRDELAYENAGFGRSYMVEYMVRKAMIEGAAPTSVQAAFDYAATALAHDYPDRAPVEVDHAGGPIDLRQGGHSTTAARSDEPPPPPQRSPSDDPNQPPGDGGEPRPNDGCSALTLGVVRCGAS